MQWREANDVCGIYGMIARAGDGVGRVDRADAMRRALRHRGPDGHGEVRSSRATVGVTRLRVVDLDPRADQPFADPTGEVVLACNGEIYNAARLRRRFPDYALRSRSDVEVILPLYLAHGPRGLAELDGMFALAIWDGRRSCLTLARDRAGEKPLFYAEGDGELRFASELGAFLRAGIAGPLDPAAVAEFAMLGYVREPRTLFAAVRKVPAGTVLTFAGDTCAAERYWDPLAGPAEPADAMHMRELLWEAVGKQLAADVPVGVFTSGGLDSSILATLAAHALGPDQVHTFSVGFRDRAFDERRFATRLAHALGTRHVGVEVPESGVPAALDALAGVGEPIADPAAIPTWFLSRAARQHVTVVLSGEGADELFGGYPTYLGHLAAPRFARLPRAVRTAVRRTLERLPASAGRMPLEFLLKRFVNSAGLSWPERHAAWFGSGLPREVLEPPWRPAAPMFAGADPDDPDVVGAAMRLDYETALRERLLVKVDRATMLASLEARAPFLDPAVTRAALGAPGEAHVRGITTKRLLREVARPWVPGFILRRGKRGLTVPVGRWLNGSLAGSLDTALDPDRLDGGGLFSGRVVGRLVAEHRAGRANHARGLWTLFTLHHWMRHWGLEVDA
jgi:asparagine synthase (glutamine-hydrolysing)